VPIRELAADAPESVFAFLDTTVGKRGAEHWRWKYRLGTAGPPPALYWEEDDGRVLGFIGMMHTHLESASGRIPAAWFVDWHVAPGTRSVGIGMGLLRKAEATAGVLLTLQGSADTREILPRLGWKRSDSPAVYVRPLSARYLARASSARLPEALGPVARVAAAAAGPALRCPEPAAPPGVSLVDVDRLPPEHDGVWRTRTAEFAPAMTRDSAYLNHLCADYPEGGYRMKLLREGDATVGHLVLRLDTDRQGSRRGRVVDWIWPRTRRKLGRWLARRACAELQRAGADYAEVVVSANDVREGLPRLFQRRRSLPIWYHSLPAGAEHPDGWFITFLDCDRAYR
jgi:hypothetical protein